MSDRVTVEGIEWEQTWPNVWENKGAKLYRDRWLFWQWTLVVTVIGGSSLFRRSVVDAHSNRVEFSHYWTRRGAMKGYAKIIAEREHIEDVRMATRASARSFADAWDNEQDAQYDDL